MRFAAYPYSTLKKNANKKHVHLTNYSINKKKAGNPLDCDEDDPFNLIGNKWSFSTFRSYIRQTYGEGKDTEIFADINDVIIKSLSIGHRSNLVSLFGLPTHTETETRGANRNSFTKKNGYCYELYGLDVLLDTNFKPWLLEVNISPALKSSCDADFTVKTQLVRDMFNLVGFRIKDVELCKDEYFKK